MCVCVCVNSQSSDEFQALSKEFKAGCPWESLYTDDLVLIAQTLEDLKLTIRKDNIEAKGLRVNVNKTKLVCCRHNSSVKSDPIKWPCSNCRLAVGSNSQGMQESQKRARKSKGGQNQIHLSSVMPVLTTSSQYLKTIQK